MPAWLFGFDDSLRKLIKELKEKLSGLQLLNALIIGFVFLAYIARPIWDFIIWGSSYVVKLGAIIIHRTGPPIKSLETGAFDPYFFASIIAGLLCVLIVAVFERNKMWPDQ